MSPSAEVAPKLLERELIKYFQVEVYFKVSAS